MSSAVFPTLIGQGWSVIRKPIWSTNAQRNTSGKETRIGYYSFPLYEWDLTFNVLRQGVMNGQTLDEYTQLFGFFNNRMGMLDSFLYNYPEDNAVTDQGIGLGDASTVSFQLVRAYGGNVGPVLAPNIVANVKIDGVAADPSTYSVSQWGSANPGVVTFTAPPADSAVITSTFTYYWPVRFTDDTMDFEQFMDKLFKAATVNFISIK